MENLARPSNAPDEMPRSSTEFVKQWVAMFAEHYRQELSELQVALYLKGLADLSNMEIEHGCSEALKACRFMPTVADIRDGLKNWRQSVSLPAYRQLEEPEIDEEGKKKVAAMLKDLATKLDIRATAPASSLSDEELRRRADKQLAALDASKSL